MARMTRVSTWNVLVPPTCSNSRSCSTRSNLTCMAGLAVLISSRKIVPSSASLNLPSFSPTAPVNAPATWPNSSLSSSVSGSAPQATSTNGLSRRAAAAVDGPGNQRLAGAAFAGDQHGGLGVGHGVDHVEDFQHAMIVADDVLHAEAQVELGLERLVLLDHLLLVERPLDGHQQLFVDQRLGQEVEGPEADGLDRGLDCAIAGDHDHGRGGTILAAMGQQIETVVVAQPNIGQHQIVGLAIDGRPAFGEGGRGVDGIALIAEPVGHRSQHVAVVVDQQQRSQLFHS